MDNHSPSMMDFEQVMTNTEELCCFLSLFIYCHNRVVGKRPDEDIVAFGVCFLTHKPN